jgi:hypothetical protein
LPAIDDQATASDERRSLGKKKHDRIRDLAGGPESLQRHLRPEHALNSFALLANTPLPG